MKFRMLRQKKTYWSWLLSYLIIVAAAVLCSSVFYLVLSGVVNRMVGGANEKILQDIKITMDFYIEDMRNIAAELGDSPLMDSLNGAQEEGEYLYYSQWVKNELGKYKTLNTNLDNIYVYSKSRDLMISSERAGSLSLMYDINYGARKDTKVTWEEWNSLFASAPSMRLMTFPMVNAYQQEKETLVLLQTLPGYYEDDLLLLVSVKPELISDLLNDDVLFDECYLYLLDRNNNMILTNGPEIDTTQLRVSGSLSDQAQKIDGETFIVTGKDSAYLKLQYVFLIPKAAYYKVPNQVRGISFFSILLFLALGLMISFWLLKRNYQPLRDLLQYVDTLKVVPPEDTRDERTESNEFYIFKKAISNIVSEKQHTQRKLEEQGEAVRKTLLYNIFTGKSGADFQVDDIMFYYDVDFAGDDYIVLVYYIEQFSELFDGTEQEIEEQIQLVLLVIKNITKELLDAQFENIYTEIDGMNVCLINIEEDDYDTNFSLIKEILEKAQQIIRENFYIEFSVAISRQHHGTSGITIAYQESMEALSYRMMTGKRGLLCYGEWNVQSEEYSYSIETELSLIGALRSGNAEQASELINHIFQTQIQSQALTLELAKCLMMDIVSTLLKMTHEFKEKYQIDCTDEIARLRKILGSDSFENIQEEILAVIQSMCRAISDKKNTGGSRIVEKVKRYIEQNYTDVNLTLNSIADELNISHTYLSRIFKIQSGEGVLQYINTKRLSEAKRLLEEQKFNVVEIAQKVGYANSNTFIRSFKKYHGVTPGRYREIASERENKGE